MKIGVIGVSGFIGTAFVKEALKEGHTVLGWDIVEPHQKYDARKFSFYRWENGVFRSQSKLGECDCVLLLASKRLTNDFSIRDYLGNIAIASDVFQICKEMQVRNIVVLSSTSVYSDENIPWKEIESNIALNLYGASKAAIDELVKYYNKQYFMNIKSLRLAQVIGLGERKGYLLNTFIDNAIEKKTLSIWGTGEGKRQYVYIKDVIGAIFAAFRSYEGGIYNIGMKDSVSTYRLAEIINQVFDNIGNIQMESEKPEDLQHRIMDVTKAKVGLFWEATYNVQSALEDIKISLCKEKDM